MIVEKNISGRQKKIVSGAKKNMLTAKKIKVMNGF